MIKKKRRKASPKRRKASPKRRKASPKKKSPKRRKKPKKSAGRKKPKKSAGRKKPKKSIRIKISNKGSLTSLGYKMRSSAKSRHTALNKAVKKYGYGSVMRKVNALYVFNKNKRPSLAKIAQSDKNYLRKTFK